MSAILFRKQIARDWILSPVMHTHKDRNKATRVIQEIALASKLQVSDLLGPRRKKPIFLARAAAMKICKDELDMSFPEIGRAFNRDHTSVMHAVKRIAEIGDEDLPATMDLIAIRAGITPKSHMEAA